MKALVIGGNRFFAGLASIARNFGAIDASFPVTAVRFPIVLGIDDYTERLKFHVERIALSSQPRP